MPHRFDATLKDLVAPYPKDFAAIFGWPVNEPATSLNVDLSTISAATDVALGFGDPLRYIVDLNFQSGPDAELLSRLLIPLATSPDEFFARAQTLVDDVDALARLHAEVKAVFDAGFDRCVRARRGLIRALQ